MRIRVNAVVAALVAATLSGGSSFAQERQEGPGGGTPGTSSNVDLVGHDPLFDRGMNAALAVFEDFVYVGNRTDGSSRCGPGDPRREVDLDSCPHVHPGILVVNASDPSDPRVVEEIEPPFAGNVGETTRELRVWPGKELLIVESFQCSTVIHSCVAAGVVPTFRFFDLSDPANPTFLSEWVPRQANGVIRTPHEFYLWEDPDDPDRGLLWISTPTGNRNPVNSNLLIADISAVPEGGSPTLVAQGTWNDQFPVLPNVALHSMTPTVDGTQTHLAYLSGFFLILDTTDVAEGRYAPGEVLDLNDNLLTPVENRPTWENPNPGHSAVPFPGRPFSFVTDEVYGTFTSAGFGCPWGWARALQVARPARPQVLGEYKLPENSCPPPSRPDQERASYASHNPTLTRNLALVTWHSGGFQVIDIEDPGQMTQVGWLSPTPLQAVANEDPALSMGTNKVVMWSFPIVEDGLIYVVDVRNGLYILEYTGRRANEISSLSFLEGNSNLGDAVRIDKSAGGDGDG
ncbi:hypothetical protein E1262_17940 [Jiangella aurantiaca]|uniref:LVIVD repeat-containing protein n=1 Tax=Jiangella aurantiaca TaxID=2530373 RepID=A0A4R5A6X2_9ACTN|nr:hypothetical protein [Jiangella aurantiaca]TDD67888.1 hypothetical protein E1262_17940 [Jiangella aurantiaca]